MENYLYYTNKHEALYLAVIENRMVHVKHLLERGANVHLKNDRGITLLCWAAMLVNGEKLFRLLLRYGAKPDVADIDGKTPLHYAAVRGNHTVVAILLNDVQKININALDKWHHSALYFAAREGYSVIVKQLLKKGAYADAYFDRSFLGRWFCKLPKINSTPLIESVKNHHQDITQTLVQSGANVNATDYWNNTALHHAVHLQDMRTITWLINAKADTLIKNNNGYTPKEIVCLQNKKNVFAYLAANMKNRLGWHTSPLNEAAFWLTLLNGEERVVLFMLSQMSRAKSKRLWSADYPVDLSFNILRGVHYFQYSAYRHLPTEIWQRIAAFWLRDLLSLDVSVEQMNITMGYVFSHMNDFFQPKVNPSSALFSQNLSA